MPITTNATPLNRWKISCGVDKGSITQNGSTRVFKTSSNKCRGGTFNQRAEIKSGDVKPTIKGAYRFSSYISMKSSSRQKFDIFQLHDGRDGCAPPLKVEVLSGGNLKLVSDVKTGPGESCIRSTLNNKTSRGTIRRDGTEQKLDVLINFDGKGGFVATVSIDGRKQISGTYTPKENANYRPKRYYFKHGVYSKNRFQYVMTSRNMKVRKVR